MKKYIPIIGLLLLSINIFASSEIIEKANKAYIDGAYTEAIELYSGLVDEGYEAFELYYNLGNSYFKNGDIARSIYFFEKAKKLKPGDSDTFFNLKVANTKITDRIEIVPDFIIVRWIKSVYNMFSADAWARLSIVFFIVLFVCLTIFFLTSIMYLKKISFYSGIFALVLTIFSLIFAYTQYQNVTSTKEAIVFSLTITVKSSPNESSTDLFVIHEGLKVKIKESFAFLLQ